MKEYYDRRATEYDDVYLGTGLCADRERAGWSEELARLVEVLRGLPPRRTVDVACGTGFLTRYLRGRVTALDQSANMLELAAGRVPGATLVLGDAIPLPFPDASFDRIFTSFFYGHLEQSDRRHFLAEARRVADELVVVDSAHAHRAGRLAAEWQERILRDGSHWRVYKRYFTASGLCAELGGGSTLHSGRWFVAVSA